MSHKTFAIDLELTWHPNRIPPRCRKPRPVPETEQVVLKLPVYEVDEAPVVARIHSDFGIGVRGVDASEVRYVDGRFYALRRDHDGSVVTADSLPTSTTCSSYSSDFEAALEQAREPFAGLAIIGEQVWSMISEPVYYCQTFGLGGNHGGTSLFVGVLDSAMRSARQASIYSALDPGAALAAAGRVATGRGDTRSVERMRADMIEVLDPRVFKVPSIAQREGQARAQIAGLLDDAARQITAGTVDRDSFRLVKELLEQAEEAMYEHDILALDRS